MARKKLSKRIVKKSAKQKKRIKRNPGTKRIKRKLAAKRTKRKLAAKRTKRKLIAKRTKRKLAAKHTKRKLYIMKGGNVLEFLVELKDTQGMADWLATHPELAGGPEVRAALDMAQGRDQKTMVQALLGQEGTSWGEAVRRKKAAEAAAEAVAEEDVTTTSTTVAPAGPAAEGDGEAAVLAVEAVAEEDVTTTSTTEPPAAEGDGEENAEDVELARLKRDWIGKENADDVELARLIGDHIGKDNVKKGYDREAARAVNPMLRISM